MAEKQTEETCDTTVLLKVTPQPPPKKPPKRPPKKLTKRLTQKLRERPPKLKLKFLERLGLLLIINSMPIIGALYIFEKWWKGEVTFTDTSAVWVALVVVVGAVLCVVCFWIMMPTAIWFRNYTLWHFHNTSKTRWALPIVISHILWLLTWFFCILMGVAAIVAMYGAIAQMIWPSG